MAIAVVGGLISSTLSLLFIPAIFTIVDGVITWLRGGLARMFANQKTAPPASTASR